MSKAQRLFESQHLLEEMQCAISLQYIKEEVSDEVNFLHDDKHQSFLQVDTIFFAGLARYA